MNRGLDAVMAAQRIRRPGIRPRARISALSGSERAQVALTLVLAKRPELFLLDEQMANLDPLARREFLGSVFEACQETGSTVLYSSHAVAELERVCDYLIVLRTGRVRLAGDIDELRSRHRVIRGPDGWPDGGGWQVVSQRAMAGRPRHWCAATMPGWPGRARRTPRPPSTSWSSATSTATPSGRAVLATTAHPAHCPARLCRGRPGNGLARRPDTHRLTGAYPACATSAPADHCKRS